MLKSTQIKCWLVIAFVFNTMLYVALGQNTGDTAKTDSQSTDKGSSDKPGDARVKDSFSHDAIVFELNTQSAYDDNVLGNNQNKVGDYIFETGVNAKFQHDWSRFNLTVDYRPDFVIYKNFPQFNQLNQDLNLAGVYRASRHITVNVRDITTFQRGVAVVRPTENDVNAPGSPELNPSI